MLCRRCRIRQFRLENSDGEVQFRCSVACCLMFIGLWIKVKPWHIGVIQNKTDESISQLLRWTAYMTSSTGRNIAYVNQVRVYQHRIRETNTTNISISVTTYVFTFATLQPLAAFWLGSSIHLDFSFVGSVQSRTHYNYLRVVFGYATLPNWKWIDFD
jgi:hypothetical protein